MKKIKILMIDDNKKLVSQAMAYFNNDNMELKHVAYNGLDGVNIVLKELEDYDIILLDMVMPEKDGFYVLDMLEELEIKKSVIVLTGYNWELIINRVSQYNISYFMMKPVDFGDLAKRIEDIYYLDCEKTVVDSQKYKKIVNILHKLGMPSNLKGFDYVKSAIILLNRRKIIVKEIYTILAEEYGTTNSNVERSIRHAIEKSWDRTNVKAVEEIFGHSVNFNRSKPTNSEFIKTIAAVLNLEN